MYLAGSHLLVFCAVLLSIEFHEIMRYLLGKLFPSLRPSLVLPYRHGKRHSLITITDLTTFIKSVRYRMNLH